MNNIVISQFHGHALSGTTGPSGLYNASSTSFIPNANIIKTWTGGYWTLTFPVSGFSGFFIHTGATPLAIDLRSISATNFGSRNRVDWSTASEQDGDRFEVQRSGSGQDFTAIGQVRAKGQESSYSYWDEHPFAGINYYRLKMLHTDGHFSYSQTVTAVVRENGSFSLEAFPNPTADVLNIRVYGSQASSASVSICDLAGKAIKIVPVSSNIATIDIRDLADGIYLVKYEDDKNTQTIKVSKR
jgi:hypothetical protein